MDTRWLKGFPAEEFEARRKEVASYKNAFKALVKLLEAEGEEKRPNYDSPAWAYHQADVNGANRKLQDIIKIITLKE